MSLLEVVASMLVCGIGLAGTLSAVQASQRLATSAEYRAVATREIQSAVDMMRANRLGANVYVTESDSGASGLSFGDAGLALCKDRTPKDGVNDDKLNDATVKTPRAYCLIAQKRADEIANEEIKNWKGRISELLPSGKGKISAEQKGGIYVFTVRVSWVIGNENIAVTTNPVEDSIQMSFSL